MAHTHHHNHHHHGIDRDQVSGRLWIALFLNLGQTVIEVIGGLLSNSLALISDAVHNLSDTTSLGVALIARKISRWEADEEKTFGYKRAEIIGAFINLVVLVVIALFLIKEGIERYYSPETIDGLLMAGVAALGLIANLGSMLLLHRDSKNNLNIKSAYVHLLWDTISSVGVIIGGIIVWLYEFYLVDTVLTVAIACYILYHSYYLLKETIDILMEATPDEIDVADVTRAMQQTPDVLDVHHVHIWRLNEQNIMLESHVVIDENKLSEMERIKSELKNLLGSQFNIHHSTLEFEFEPCEEHAESPCH